MRTGSRATPGRFHQPADARPEAERGEKRKWRGDGLGGRPWRRLDASTSQLTLGRSPGGGRAAQPGVRCCHRFPMRRETAVRGEPGLPHGTTLVCGLWRVRRSGVVRCTSGVAIAGRDVGSGQAKPYRLPGPFGAGTPGSRWRGNPGLWKSSPSGNGPMQVMRAMGEAHGWGTRGFDAQVGNLCHGYGTNLPQRGC